MFPLSLILFQDQEESFLKLKSSSQISGEESGRYTVTRTRRIITSSGGQVSSSTNDKEIADFLISFYVYHIRACQRHP